jgi:septum formation protein
MSLRRAAFVFTRLLFATSSSPSIIISGSGSSSGCAAALSISSRFPAPPPVMEPGTLPPLVLASKSPTRQLILREMGFSFLCIPADIDEKAIGDRLRDKPEELVLEIGRAKAAKVLAELEKQQQQQQEEEEEEEGGVGGGQQGQRQSPLPPLPLEPGTLLLAGDQVVVYDGAIREKPTDAAQAREFIRSYARLPCATVGSCVVVDPRTGRRAEGVDATSVAFSAIPDDVVDRLVEEGDVLHCAGGLMIEHPLVQPYIVSVDGSIDSVMGLSKALVQRLVAEVTGLDGESPLSA